MINTMEQLRKLNFGIIVYERIYGEIYRKLKDKGFYAYSIRHSDLKQTEMATIEPDVRVNHYADIITTKELVFDEYNTIILDEESEKYINENFFHTSYSYPFKTEKEMEESLINDMKLTGKDELLDEIIRGRYGNKPNPIIDYFLKNDQSIDIAPNGEYFYTTR